MEALLVTSVASWLTAKSGDVAWRSIGRSRAESRVRALLEAAVVDAATQVGGALPPDDQLHLRNTLLEFDSKHARSLELMGSLDELTASWARLVNSDPEMSVHDRPASIGYLDQLGIRPDELADALAEAFRSHLERSARSDASLRPLLGRIQHEEIAGSLASIEDMVAGMVRPARESALELSSAELRLAYDSYLAWLVDTNSKLPVRGISTAGQRAVDLDRVYVALKLDTRTAAERMAANDALHQGMRSAIDKLDPSDARADLGEWIVEANLSTEMGGISGISSIVVSDGDDPSAIAVDQLCTRYPVATVLGDPGSGKTTLMRWLVLKHALALTEGQDELIVPASQLRVGESQQDQVSLGPSLLPVPVRLADYVEHNRSRQDRDLGEHSLLQFLGNQKWEGRRPVWLQATSLGQEGEPIDSEIIQVILGRAIDQQSAFVVVDGLDEVEAADRLEAVGAVVELARRLGVRDGESGGRSLKSARENRLIVTSRIVGYDVAAMPEDVAHVTIERMKPDTRDHFIRHWFSGLGTEGLVAETGVDTDAYATELIASLSDPSERYASELATNPLLASVLVSVFIDQGGALPPQRIELYQRAVEALVAGWIGRSSSLGGRPPFQWILDVLPGLAYKVHREYPTGLVSERKLRELLIEGMNEVAGSDGASSIETRVRADEAIAVAREGMGLIAEAGTGAYRFSHLTFQEFLAAQHLVNVSDLTATRVRGHLGDPRWHESVLMSVALVNLRSEADLVAFIRSLLTHPHAGPSLIPEIALLLANAFMQMTSVPSGAVRLVAEELLASYARLVAVGGLADTRKVVVDTVVSLRDHMDSSAVDDVLGRSIEGSGDPEGADLAALMTIEAGIVSEKLADRLLAALPRDTSRHDYPLARALQAMIGRAPLHRSGESNRSRLGQEWCPAGLPMRRMLLARPDLVEKLNKDWRLLAIATVLYGGFSDEGAQAATSEYERVSNYLHLDSDVRAPYEHVLKTTTDVTDPSYEMAVRLDTRGGEFEQRWSAPPRFSADRVVRDSPCTPYVRQALLADDVDGLSANLVTNLSSQDAGLKTDSLLALWSIGLASDELIDTHVDVAANVRSRINQLSLLLSDPVARGCALALEGLLGIYDPETVADFDVLFEVVLALNHRSGGRRFLKYTPPSAKGPSLVSTWLLSEIVSHWAGPAWIDVVKRWIGGDDDQGDARILVAALCLRGQNRRGLSQAETRWYADSLSFSYDLDDVPITVVDQMLEMTASAPDLGEFCLLRTFGPLASVNPDLGVLYDVLRWYLVARHAVLGLDTTVAAADWWREPDPAEALVERGRAASSAWYRCRSLLRVADAVSVQRSAVLAEVLADAESIADPRHSFEIFERLASRLTGVDRQACAERCRSLAWSMSDPADAAKAWLRLSRLDPANHQGHLTRALDRLALSDGSTQRAMARIIRSDFCDDARDVFQLREFLSRNSSGEAADYVLGRWSAVIARHRERLYSETGEGAESFWVPIELYVRTHEQAADFTSAFLGGESPLDGPTPGIGDDWSQMRVLNGPMARSIERSRLTGELTAEVARDLEFVAGATPDVLPTVASWSESDDAVLARLASLLRAETLGLNLEDVTRILDLLGAETDLLSYRARRVLQGGGSSRLAKSTLSLGAESLKELGSFRSVQSSYRPADSLRIAWMFEGVIFDDPQWMRAALLDDGAPSESAAALIRSMRWPTYSVAAAMAEGLTEGTPRAVATVIDGIASVLATRDPVQDREAMWAMWWSALSKLSPADHVDVRLETVAEHAVVEIAFSVLGRTGGRFTEGAGARALDELRSQTTIRLEVLLGSDESDARRMLLDAGLAQVYHEFDVRAVLESFESRRMEERSRDWDWEPLAVDWLNEALDREWDTSVSALTTGSVLVTAAAIARLSPHAFADAAAGSGLGDRLAGAVQFHGTFTGRRAATELIGVLKPTGQEVVPALRAALGDVPPVRSAALEVVPKLNQISFDAVGELVGALRSESSVVAWSTAHLLASIGRNRRTSTETRERIMTALSEAIEGGTSKRRVRFAYLDRAIPEMPQLDDVFATALRQMYRLT